MSAGLAPALPPPRRAPGIPSDWLPALGIVLVAVLAGLALGDPRPEWLVPAGAVGLASVWYAGARWPFAGLVALVGSTILLVVVAIPGGRAVNLFDLLLPPVLLASAFGAARRDARAHPAVGPAHERLAAAERRFTRWVLAFYALAVLSLGRIAQLVGAAHAVESAYALARALEGLALYPLCSWWLRSRERVEHAWRALYVAGLGLVLVNLVGVPFWGVYRAGMTVYLNDPAEPISSPNEAGTAALIVGAVLVVRQALRPQARNPVLGLLLVVLLALSQSRSAMLAWLTFALLTLRYVRPSRLLAGVLSLAALLPLLPQAIWERLSKSAAVERGSFEAFSFFQRVYGWRTAWRMFLDDPWLGVGYLGYRFLSHRYNELRVSLITVENYFFEMLVGLGVFGLLVLVIAVVQLYRLGREVGRVAPAGTLAHHMARLHAPLLTALIVANLTGDNLVGMVSVAQLAMWTAVMVRAGHAAIPERSAA